MSEFLNRQLNEIKNKGFSIIFFKIYRRLKNFLYFFILIIYFPLFLIVVGLRSLFKFRFGLINSKRIGHLTMNTAIYYNVINFLKLRKINSDNYDILIHNLPICNSFLFNKWKDKLKIFNPFFIIPLYDLICISAKYFKFSKKLLIPSFAPHIFGSGDIDRHDLLNKSEFSIKFSLNEKKKW